MKRFKIFWFYDNTDLKRKVPAPKTYLITLHFCLIPELATFFELANYVKSTPKERDICRTAQHRAWGSYSILDYAKKESREERAIAKEIRKGKSPKA